MPAAAFVTIIIGVVLVAALAFYLLWVIVLLRGILDTLGKVTFGVRAIAARAEPVTPVLTEVNANLEAVAGALEGLVAKVTGDQPEKVVAAS